MVLSYKLRTFRAIFIACFKYPKNLEHFEKKRWAHSLSKSEITKSESHRYFSQCFNGYKRQLKSARKHF